MCDPSILAPLIPELTKAVGCFSDYVASKMKTIQDLNPKISALKKEIKNLENSKKKVEDKKEVGEKEGKKIKSEVIEWLKEVEGFVNLKPVEEMFNNRKAFAMWLKEEEEMVNNNNNKTLEAWVIEVEEMVNKKEKHCTSFLNCCDSELHKVSREVERKTQRIKELLKDAEFPNGVIDTESLIPVVRIRGPTIQDQKTAKDTLNEVKGLLGEDGTWSIGIWGLAGIGKTTLVRTLNNELKNTLHNELKNTSTQSKPFTVVIWVEVSNRFDRDDDDQRLQTLIAKRLNMEGQMGEDMGNQLRQKLMNEKFLLILDDVWKKIDLDKLGIPRHEENKGCKIILTTRFKQVCRDMGTNKEVKMNVLNPEEAEQLFNQEAKYEGRSKKIKQLAKEIVEECCGLPQAITVVGTAMSKTTEVEQWRHALNELQRSVPSLEGIKNKVYMPLKYSYESLQDNTIKSCFLYCSLFPEDFSIERTKLVEHWMAEGLIDEQKNYLDSMSEGIHMIERLKDSCLLEDGVVKDTVKMHDVVRDVAIWIASSFEGGCRYLVRTGNVSSEISNGNISNSSALERVSFMNNKITKLPDSVICPNASTLLLQHNGSLDTVPEGFLQGFKAVRVLNLGSTNIGSLPHSLLQLCDLRALILSKCKSLEELPPLGELCSLQMLDLHASGIRELPIGMEKLSNLRQLDLSFTGKLKTIKAGIISGLSSLQVLDMTCSAFYFCVNDEEEKGQTTFEELKDFGCRLCILSIQLKRIPEDLSWIDRLSKFQFFIGPKVLFTRTEHDRRVVIGGLELTQKSIIQLRSIASLESLTISRCQVVKCPSDPPPNRGVGLEELHLYRVSGLESVGDLGLNFSELNSIEVCHCSDMKYLFSYGTLPTLEVIQVRFCNNLKELFNYDLGQNMASDPVVPEVRILELWGLSKLRTLCRDKETWSRLEEVEVYQCPHLIRLPLANQNAGAERPKTNIRGSSKWWNALEWDDDTTKSSPQLSFCPWHPSIRQFILHKYYNMQHFFSQKVIIHTLQDLVDDEDFVREKRIGCFLRRASLRLRETDGITRDSVKAEEGEDENDGKH